MLLRWIWSKQGSHVKQVGKISPEISTETIFVQGQSLSCLESVIGVFEI